MSLSWDRGYVEPLAALAAVFAVVVGLTLYVGALDEAVERDDRPVADAITAEIIADAGTMGILEHASVRSAAPPAGWNANVTLSTRAGRLQRGPSPPEDADVATRQVSVRLGPGTVRPGRLTVEAWR
jgi:hypothetical protein